MTTDTATTSREAHLRTRSALYLDFDNIFNGLFKLDPHAALAFGEHPDRWLEGLTTAGGAHRDLLVRRAYLNPQGSVRDEHAVSGSTRIPLSRFRAPLTRAGLEVVDCPSLSREHKNAADIRMVIDVIDATGPGSHLDEVIVASSDADFAPLLHRLRAGARHTVVLSTNPMAHAYRAIAHEVIEADVVRAMLTPPQPEVPAVPVAPDAVATVEPAGVAGDALAAGPAAGDEVSAVIDRLCGITWLPRGLAASEWPAVLAALATYFAQPDAPLNAAGRWARAHLADQGVAVGRTHLDKAVNALRFAGVVGQGSAADTASADVGTYVRALVESLAGLARRSGWAMDDAERDALATWLSGSERRRPLRPVVAPAA